ncbi:MAG: aminodeoxychorismate/anthranilate synthase component II [Planctomycetes bacterium]|nr:aminodeoxychorismate/anthranilate synthase component II [Planctomycetota bacterium]
MIFLLDNYDSFTYNLVQRLGEIDPSLDIRVERNDQTTLEEIEAWSPERIIISPGPCTPAQSGLSKAVIERFGPRVPTLGVCLGHQCLAEVYRSQVVRADRLMHGKTSQIYHDGRGVFAGLPNPFEATRYHSLVVEDPPENELEVCAWTADGDHPRELMGLRHRRHPVHAVQFHPESFLTAAGYALLENFLRLPVEAAHVERG